VGSSYAGSVGKPESRHASWNRCRMSCATGRWRACGPELGSLRASRAFRARSTSRARHARGNAQRATRETGLHFVRKPQDGVASLRRPRFAAHPSTRSISCSVSTGMIAPQVPHCNTGFREHTHGFRRAAAAAARVEHALSSRRRASGCEHARASVHPRRVRASKIDIASDERALGGDRQGCRKRTRTSSTGARDPLRFFEWLVRDRVWRRA